MTSPDANDIAVTYTGAVPVDEDTLARWYRDGVTNVRISYVNDLGTLIDYSDMDECNTHMDEITGVPLIDLTYGIDYAGTAALAPEPGGDGDSLVMWVDGEIDWSMADIAAEDAR